MGVFGILAVLFVVVPIAELALLIQVGQALGLWPTLGLVLATGVFGAALARSQGIRAFQRFQRELAAGAMPDRALQDGIAVLIGGMLLLTPGLLTDLLGFSLLVPFTRHWMQRRLRSWASRRIADGSIQVVSMGGGVPWSSGPLGPDFGGPQADDARRGLDPRNEIRVDQPTGP